jgi:(+)-pinoresinol hydroxylase
MRRRYGSGPAMRTAALIVAAGALGMMTWHAAVAAGEDAQGAAGRLVYERWCAACHDPGIEHPGTNALTTKYKGVKSGVILEWTDLPPEFVRHIVRTGISVMPQFRKTEISDADLDALAAYLSRNTPR